MCRAAARKLMFPTMPMSESGRKHFEEVKDIFLAMQWVAVLGLAVFGIYLLRDAVRTGKMREAAAFSCRSHAEAAVSMDALVSMACGRHRRYRAVGSHHRLGECLYFDA